MADERGIVVPEFNPAVPDFLRIAQEAADRRRQAEMDRLNQLVTMDNLRRNAIANVQDAINMGMPAKEALAQLQFRDPFVESSAKAFEKAKVQMEEQRLAKEAAAAEAPVADYFRSNMGAIASSPDASERITNALESPEQENPLLQLLKTYQENAPVIAQYQERERIKKLENDLQRKRAEASIEAGSQLYVDEQKRVRDREQKLEDDLRTRSVSFYSNILTDMLVDGAPQEEINQFSEKVLQDPTMGGKYAPALLGMIQMNALSAKRAAQSAIEIRDDIAARSGVRVSQRTAQMIADQKAIEDPFSHVPLAAKDASTKQRLAYVSAAMDALASAQASAILVASKDKGGRGAEARSNEFVRTLGFGSSDPDVNSYDAAKKLVGDMITLALSGQQAAQQQIARLQAIMPKLSELTRDPKTGGLSPASARRLEEAFNLVKNLSSGASLVSPEQTNSAYRSAFDARVKQHQDRLSSVAENGSGPGAIVGGSDPRFPTIER